MTLHDAESGATLIVLGSEMAASTTIDIVATSPAHITIGLDPDVLATTLESRLSEFEKPPVEVQIEPVRVHRRLFCLSPASPAGLV